MLDDRLTGAGVILDPLQVQADLPAADVQVLTPPEWLGQRALRIGASEAAVICGCGRFESPLSLYHRKLQAQADAEALDPAREEVLYWGKALEPAIIGRFAEVTGQTETAMFPPVTLHLSRENARLVATLDAVTKKDGRFVPLEVKNVGGWFGDEWEDEPPLWYQVQCQHQMMVTGAPMAYLAALVGGNKFRWALLPRDEAFIGLLKEAEEGFLAMLDARTPPPPDGTAATTAVLKRLYPRDSGAVIELPADAHEWDEARQRCKAAVAAAEAELDLVENQIKAALGEASIGTLLNGIRYSYRVQARKAYSVEAAEYRVLRRSAPKGMR